MMRKSLLSQELKPLKDLKDERLNFLATEWVETHWQNLSIYKPGLTSKSSIKQFHQDVTELLSKFCSDLNSGAADVAKLHNEQYKDFYKSKEGLILTLYEQLKDLFYDYLEMKTSSTYGSFSTIAQSSLNPIIENINDDLENFKKIGDELRQRYSPQDHKKDEKQKVSVKPNPYQMWSGSAVAASTAAAPLPSTKSKLKGPGSGGAGPA